ncbi:toxin glutamine deamidase domain-containing protein [Actinoplanes sp. URMC 104]|uniref:toxin glutamine deamidase domain-containing protein n=1 Tax=Actinoplanes sp. URMC 104 TaxID=3423409 RepID=UPI003F19DD04
MNLLPSPVPHPLEFSPFDVPGWAYEALEWVVGFDWPAGNEVATWDVADRWYALATSLTGPNEAAMAAANRFLAGYGGEGITAEGFQDAWHQVAGDENAPLHDLLRASDELGRLVEGCGADIEAAKLEAWIEIGIFLIELAGMAVTVALTLGAASPAAGGLIVATRLAIQRIFQRLAEQLGAKALRQTAGRAIKQVGSREGLRRLGREALDEGFDEAREEIATNGGIQLYQQSAGRSDGFDFNDLGRSAAAGFAGGAAATGASAGSHGHGGLLRGAGGEVLAEFGAAATFGELPDAAGIAKSATSGAAGSAVHAMPSAIDIGLAGPELGAAPTALPSVAVGDPLAPFARTPEVPPSTSGAAPEAISIVSPPTDQGPAFLAPDSSVSSPPASSASSLLTSFFPASDSSTSPATSPSPDSPAPPSPSSPSPSTPSLSSDSTLSDPPSFSDSSSSFASSPSPDSSPFSAPSSSSAPSPTSADLSPSASSPSSADFSPSAPSPASADLSPSASSPTSADFSPSAPSPASADFSPSAPSPSLPDGSNLLASTVTEPTSAPSPSPAPTTSGSFAGSVGMPFLSARRFPVDAPGSITPVARRTPLSDLDRIAEALAPRPLPRRSAPPSPSPAALRPEARDEQAYFGYARHARQTHEQNRRDEYAAYLDAIAEQNRAKILDLGRQADAAIRAGSTLRARHHRRQALELSEIVAEIEDEITQIRSGDLAPDRVEVDPPEWARINHDVGNLAPGGVRTGDLSALDGFGGRPPVDRTRHYNVTGGLRPPLAVHQVDLENAVPRDSAGRVSRFPDPREGTWFRLANDGGPAADPTRGLNCVDGVLALFDTYMHGRPRVSAPRTFDVYVHGNPDRPLGGEVEGVRRIRLATGSDFQNLCPYLADADPAQAKPAMDQAVRNLTHHLLNTGHGAYAFIVTELEGGGSHSWAAVNQNGTVLFLDPQIGRVAEHTPMYQHHGVPAPTNLVSLEALVVNAAGIPTPLPGHGPGTWSTEAPTGTDEGVEAIRAAERQAFASLSSADREALIESVAESEATAIQVSTDLHDVVRSLAGDAHIVDEEYRVKSVESLGRKYLEDLILTGLDLDTYLATVKDRVRFSVETPEQGYGTTVASVLAGLRLRGYRTTQMASFWADRGRHNGLNVWLTDASGFRIEVQFPTPLSRAIGKDTHHSYEVLRFGGSTSWDRVDAFLKILQVNKQRGIDERRPSDLHLIDGIRTKASTFASWLASEAEMLTQYKAALSARRMSFEDHLRQYGLERDDVPGLEEMGMFE